MKHGDPAHNRLVAHPNLRWHFYVAPKSWSAADSENLTEGAKFTTAPLTMLAPGFKGDHLRLKFKDPSAQVIKCMLLQLQLRDIALAKIRTLCVLCSIYPLSCNALRRWCTQFHRTALSKALAAMCACVGARCAHALACRACNRCFALPLPQSGIRLQFKLVFLCTLHDLP